MRINNDSEREISFSGYNDLLNSFDHEQKVVDLCALLHSCELELSLKIEGLSIFREINLIRNNLIVKVFLRSDDLLNHLHILRNKKNALAFQLRRIQAAAGFYETNENRIHYYILMPIDEKVMYRVVDT